jgi:hypothetical protein
VTTFIVPNKLECLSLASFFLLVLYYTQKY